uniref:uncharacterized protein LOC120341288 n=1 Tax=Styela clava TaxID=7725 RepID=UPI001939673D|nr:uncharacterized protein LOC120341288 [Styela clava]
MDTFEKACLDAHNAYRKAHNTRPLKWNKQCSEKAKAWANTMAKTGNFKHSDNKLGENIACAMGVDFTGEYATKMWYSEIKDYSFENHGTKNGKPVGHFTQVVWKESTEAGFGFAKAENGMMYACGNYTPQGNVYGQYKDNVGELTGKLDKELDPKNETESESSDVPKPGVTEKTNVEIVDIDGKKWEKTTITTTTVTKNSDGSLATSISTVTKSRLECHFTQVVWKESTEAGFGFAKAENGMMYACGNYTPQGNVYGQYKDNVGELTGKLDKELDPKNETESESSDVPKPGVTEKTNVEIVDIDGKKWEKTTITTTTVTKNSDGSLATSISTVTKSRQLNDVSDGMDKLGLKDKPRDGQNVLSSGDTDKFSTDLINVINKRRENHGAGSLQMKRSMQDAAQKHAEEMLKSGDLFGYTDRSYGQTITMKMPRPSGEEIADMWYEGGKDYDSDNPDKNTTAASYFTQMVWRSTKEIGVGIASNEDGESYIAALYNPGGNTRGQYKENVRAKEL